VSSLGRVTLLKTDELARICTRPLVFNSCYVHPDTLVSAVSRALFQQAAAAMARPVDAL